jgi:hypothetical protein
MAWARTTDRRWGAVCRATAGALIVVALLAVGGCSPEAQRVRGGGLGADLGNTSLPIRMHGDRGRNNPSFGVPLPGRGPRDARGVPGWWEVRS